MEGDRKEKRRRRRRKKKLIRISVYALLAALGVVLVLGIVAIVRKVSRDREAQAMEDAVQEEISNSDFFEGAEVLHLSFPVLALDDAEVTQGAALTVSRFREILQDLYDSGYVLIDPYDLAAAETDGLVSGRIMVPTGKKPLILSQYDVSYSSEADGHADALVRDASGRISCRYTDAEGIETTQAVDVVPVVEDFLEEHPDFSYKGARGILGVTGYRGLLGYQIVITDNSANIITIEDPQDGSGGDSTLAGGDLVGDATGTAVEISGTEEAMAGMTNSDEIIRQNKETIQTLLGTLRAGGWRIASNGFDLVSYGSAEPIVKADAEEWEETVEPIVGTTDILLVPGKADIGNWSGYTDRNDRYTCLRDMGFRYYFVEDSGSLTWLQVRPEYVRQGIHQIDSYGAYSSLMAEIRQNEKTPGSTAAKGEGLLNVKTGNEDTQSGGTPAEDEDTQNDGAQTENEEAPDGGAETEG